MKKMFFVLISLIFICWCSWWDKWEYVIEDEAIEILSVVKVQAKYEDTQWFPSSFLKAYDECYEEATNNKEKNPLIMCMHIALNINAWMCIAARDSSEESKELEEIAYSKYCWLMIDGADKLNQKIAYYDYKF